MNVHEFPMFDGFLWMFHMTFPMGFPINFPEFVVSSKRRKAMWHRGKSWRYTVGPGNWLSPKIDKGVGLRSWGPWDFWELNGGFDGDFFKIRICCILEVLMGEW